MSFPKIASNPFLSVPLLSRGHVVGVLNLQNRTPHVYSEREISLISTVGFLVGAEIEMACLEKEKSRLADQLQIRKVVERAKGLLQRELKISEPQAYEMLQRQSQQRRRPMKDIAEAIVTESCSDPQGQRLAFRVVVLEDNGINKKFGLDFAVEGRHNLESEVC